jgi:small subunit ribosomal protein S8
MINHPISDMLIRIQNAQAVSKGHVSIPFSNLKFKIAGLLKEEGYIGSIEKRTKKYKNSTHDHIELSLKYNDGRGAIDGIKIISKPSRRMYIQAKDIKPVNSGYGVAVISTPTGVMTSKEAKKKNIGGELLFEIY